MKASPTTCKSTPEFSESTRPAVAGLVVGVLCKKHKNYRGVLTGTKQEKS